MVQSRKRQEPRVSLNVAVQVEHASRLQQFYSRNLSSGGIFLEIPKKLPEIGSKLQLRFAVPDLGQEIAAEAEVVHHHTFEEMDTSFKKVKRYGIGLRFVKLTKEDEALIQAYVSGKDVRVTS